MNRLLFINRLSWPVRVPLKWAVFGLALFAVQFPYPVRFVQHLRHWRDPNAMIQPDAEALRPLVEEVRDQITTDMSPLDAQKVVEKYVYRRIPYEWDWINWGNADYFPTVTEVIEKGSEDCDGRALIAASLLRNFGFKAELVTDFTHVWVKTDQGELMGPGKTAISVSDHGLAISRGTWLEIPKTLANGLGAGIGAFPLVRQLIVLVVLWLLLLHRQSGAWRGIVAFAFLLNGLLFLKVGGGHDWWHPIRWAQFAGVANVALGVLWLLVRRRYHTGGAHVTA